MNYRQAKKKRYKKVLLKNLSYRENKLEYKNYKKDLTNFYHTHKVFNGFNEEEKEMIELGIVTKAEIMSNYGCEKNNNHRWRQKRKYSSKNISKIGSILRLNCVLFDI